MIKSSDFVARMEQHWTGPLGNVSSPAFRETWRQKAETFASRIAADQNPLEDSKWTVLQPPTGSGKSQGTVVYCSMLAELPSKRHPGVLIITRHISEADNIVRAINKLCGYTSAVAYHSQSKLETVDLGAFPVLVITHSAHLTALDRMGVGGNIRQTWPLFNLWNNGGRKLVVVDEALDIIEDVEVKLDELRHTVGAIPQSVRDEHPAEMRTIERVIAILAEKKEAADKGLVQKESVISEFMIGMDAIDLTPLRYALGNVRFDRLHHRVDPEACTRERMLHDKRLQSVQSLMGSWALYARQGTFHTLTSARLLVPKNFKGCVVLDATASSNLIYSLHDKASLIAPPPGVRSYANVNLHVSRGHRVGKMAMRENGHQDASDVIANLNSSLRGRKVFLCCHKEMEPHIASLEASFELKTGHWWAVDGRNDWQDCDAAVIFGLPYRPDQWTATTFFALQGVKDDAWLQAKTRPWEKHRDVRMALKLGQLVTDVVQAINRIRCRRVIDEQGNCAPCDVYLMLPSGKTADAILEGIVKQMPDIMVKDWALSAGQRKARKSNHEEALIKWVENMPPGRQSTSTIRKALEIPLSSFERHISRCHAHDSRIGQAMARCGVRYDVQGKGRGAKSALTRD
jgi:hypothetical protein